jgi:predicted O-linked N-acetylglucosamine transferase (SPINDLY family)
LGYFSADFGNHAVSYLTAGLFEMHDHEQFEVLAFSLKSRKNDFFLDRIQNSFDQFIDVTNRSDQEIAQLSRELNIDIAIDLGGFTTGSRTGIFAYRAAPIQLSYIGYLGTMAAPYFDYLIADKTIIPPELQSHYTEQIIYLPSYQSNDRKRIVSEKIFTRQELGLPETGFVFACFNNSYKILPATFDGWMRILQKVNGSVLFIYADNHWVEENLKNEAHARGVDPQRLIFGKRIPLDQYMARYRSCDLFLDTTPYNAGTTASDALWVGLPVLTLIGESFASRVAASLLKAIDLPELITNTQEQYEARAIEFALNPDKLTAIKQKLANNRLTTPLFDTPLFTKHLEAAYTKIMERYWADLPPVHIEID